MILIWPSRKRKKPTPDQLEALAAKEHAEAQLEHAERQHAAAISLVVSLREIRRRNHFGETLQNLNWGRNTS